MQDFIISFFGSQSQHVALSVIHAIIINESRKGPDYSGIFPLVSSDLCFKVKGIFFLCERAEFI